MALILYLFLLFLIIPGTLVSAFALVDDFTTDKSVYPTYPKTDHLVNYS